MESDFKDSINNLFRICLGKESPGNCHCTERGPISPDSWLADRGDFYSVKIGVFRVGEMVNAHRRHCRTDKTTGSISQTAQPRVHTLAENFLNRMDAVPGENRPGKYWVILQRISEIFRGNPAILREIGLNAQVNEWNYRPPVNTVFILFIARNPFQADAKYLFRFFGFKPLRLDRSGKTQFRTNYTTHQASLYLFFQFHPILLIQGNDQKVISDKNTASATQHFPFSDHRNHH
ncbi:MAG: hypothetical protein DDT32_01982 [Syntrophomonadaceae bacterium]|nr:hypothetical protein [Bacillota bacterium]MBT9148212.1 hypothetical protein [Bacillota bacterium]